MKIQLKLRDTRRQFASLFQDVLQHTKPFFFSTYVQQKLLAQHMVLNNGQGNMLLSQQWLLNIDTTTIALASSTDMTERL